MSFSGALEFGQFFKTFQNDRKVCVPTKAAFKQNRFQAKRAQLQEKKNLPPA